jgi:hypothetical protein
MFLAMGQLRDEILQSFINKHIIVDLENVQRSKKKEKLQDIKLAQTRCQNLSMSLQTIAYSRSAIFLHFKNRQPEIGQPWPRLWEICPEGVTVGK